jgi:transketolase
MPSTLPFGFPPVKRIGKATGWTRREILATPAVSLEDIQQFRQLGSKTPGHPEYRQTSGVETTTGPLGQGAGNSVGMAIAARWLGARYNRPGFPLFGYRVWALCSDGDLMEGVGSETASLAGHLGLGNLCWIYDHNGITLDAQASVTFGEDVAARFAGYRWMGARRGPRGLRRGRRRAGAAAARGVGRAPRGVPAAAPGARRGARPHGAPRAARGLGRGPARVPAERPGSGDARGGRPGAQRHRPPRALARRRLGRPRLLDQDAPRGRGEQQAGEPGGRNLHFGVREHGMGAVANGLSLCNLRPFTATFLIFSDSLRPPIRLAALMEIPVLFYFSHDSIGLGEDGPTHQPVEQLAALRAIPGLVVYRPADANEVTWSLRAILRLHDTPACLVVSRQKLPVLDRRRYAAAEGALRGAYVLADAPGGRPDVILMATGSEVALCVQAYEQLTAEGVKARVVSMPSWEIFDQQPEEYRHAVLPPAVTARVAVEQAAAFGWCRYLGPHGDMIGMHAFGASAPYKELQRKFGFVPERVAQAARAQLRRR